MTDKTRWLLLLCLAQCFIMLVFINYSAVLPLLVQEWGMSNTKAGSIFSIYQLGYISSGVILSAMTDRVNTRNIFLISILWSGAANLLFALYAHDYASAMILRALTGIGMGGTYMPGLKMVAEKFEPRERGKAVGIYVGSLVLGASLSRRDRCSRLPGRMACSIHRLLGRSVLRRDHLPAGIQGLPPPCLSGGRGKFPRGNR